MPLPCGAALCRCFFPCDAVRPTETSKSELDTVDIESETDTEDNDEERDLVDHGLARLKFARCGAGGNDTSKSSESEIFGAFLGSTFQSSADDRTLSESVVAGCDDGAYIEPANDAGVSTSDSSELESEPRLVDANRFESREKETWSSETGAAPAELGAARTRKGSGVGEPCEVSGVSVLDVASSEPASHGSSRFAPKEPPGPGAVRSPGATLGARQGRRGVRPRSTCSSTSTSELTSTIHTSDPSLWSVLGVVTCEPVHSGAVRSWADTYLLPNPMLDKPSFTSSLIVAQRGVSPDSTIAETSGEDGADGADESDESEQSLGSAPEPVGTGTFG